MAYHTIKNKIASAVCGIRDQLDYIRGASTSVLVENSVVLRKALFGYRVNRASRQEAPCNSPRFWTLQSKSNAADWASTLDKSQICESMHLGSARWVRT